MRTQGILLPIFSLPGRYGIGCFSKEAYRFADFLKEAGQTYWQILPLGPTGYGDSPYQSFSTFAGNPYFISPEELIRQSLLTEAECEEALGETGADLPDRTADPADRSETEDRADKSGADRQALPKIDYGRLYEKRLPLLRLAYSRSSHREDPAFERFLSENDYWLPDYALFMALKDHFGGKPFSEWETDIADYEDHALDLWRARLLDEVGFYEYLQYEFEREYLALKDYVNALGIRIIGDIPIYVSPDSADFWAHRELFQIDERRRVRQIAGVPPDGFSADGQLWGNPLYDWPKHAETGYDWWIRRIGRCRRLYDVIRIDHFRGFDEYFAVKAGKTTAADGHWEQGPGIALFRALEAHFGPLEIIAEDLGYITDSVRQLVQDSGFPNMKVLEFAFDSRDSSCANDYLPFNYVPNCAAYTGTHDNETLRGWLDSILPEELAKVRAFLDVRTDDPQEIVGKMIRAVLSSVADTAVIPMPDWLGLGNEARINHPSTTGTNWQWRLREEDLSKDLAKRIADLTRMYGRAALADLTQGG